MTLQQLILIPGLLNDADLWRDQVSDLGDVARPEVVDITQGTTLEALAEDVLACAEDRFALAGFSFERDRLVQTARSDGKFHGFGERLLRSYLAPENLKNTAMADRVRAMTEHLGPDVFVRQSLIARPDSRASLGDITCPTLVLCGEHDALTPPAIHRDMAIAIPNSQLVIVPGSAHLTPIERPHAVSGALRALLARQRALSD